MQYSPKLKKVMEEIKEIIARNDLGAIVVLHEPGAVEFMNRVDPSYSGAFVEDGQLRIKIKLADFDGNKDALLLKVGNTVNMLQHFAEQTGITSLGCYDLLDVIRKKFEFDDLDTDGTTSHIQQNN